MVGTVLKGDLQSSIEDQLQQYARGIGSAAGGAASAVQQIPQAVGDTWEDLQRAGRTGVQDVQAQLADYATQAYNASQEAQRQAQEEAQRRAEQAAQVEQELTAHANQVLAGAQQQAPQAGAPAQAALPHTEEPGTATDVGASDLGKNWKTQFDFGATYTGDYRTGTPHRGVDLVPSSGKGIGTEVDAFTPGTVTNVSRDPGAGGLMVYVQDADGLTHAYMHLAGSNVKVGDQVQRGQPIAQMGESGTEGSPHLHYEVRKNAAVGDPLNQLIDPRPYLNGTKQPGGGGPIQAAQQAVTGAVGNANEALDRNGVVTYVKQKAREYGLDPAAVLAVANQEGLNTDPGTHWQLPGERNISFGPPSWYGNGAGADILAQHGDDAARWSWTPEGVDYWLSQVAKAKGTVGATGSDAINAIVTNFERPREDLVAGEIGKAQQQYANFVGDVQGAVGAAQGAVGGAVAGARRATGDVIQAGEQAATAARAPIYGTLAGGRDQAVQQLNVLQSQIDSLRDQLAGAPQGARQAIAGAAEPLIAGAQELGRQVGPNLGFDDAELQRRRGIVAAQQPPPSEQGPGGTDYTSPLGVAGGAARAVLGGEAFGTVTSQAQRQRAVEETQRGFAAVSPTTTIGPDVRLPWQAPEEPPTHVGGALIQGLADQIIQNPLLFVPGAPMGEAFNTVGGRVLQEFLPQLGRTASRLSAAAINGAVQNAVYEMGQPNATPQSIGAQFLAGAGFGAALHGSTELAGALGRRLIDAAPDLANLARTRQRGEVDLGLITTGEPTPRPGEAPPRPPDQLVEPLMIGGTTRAPSAPPERPVAGVQRLPTYLPAGAPEAGFEALARASREAQPDGRARIDLNSVPKDILPFTTDPSEAQLEGMVKLNPGGMPHTDDLRALWEANQHKRSFYTDQGDEAANIVGAHNTGEFFTLNSINSILTRVNSQVAESIQAAGLVRKVARDGRAAGLDEATIRQNILDALADPKQNPLTGKAVNTKRNSQVQGYTTGDAAVSSGAKTSSFAGNYTSAEGRFFDPRVTNDLHNWRLMNVSADEIPSLRKNQRTGEMEWFIDRPHEQNVANNDRAYRGVESVIGELAREYGVDGYSMQSGLWDGMRGIQRDPEVLRLWQQGHFRDAVELGKQRNLFGQVSPDMEFSGDVRSVMDSMPVRRALDQYGQYLKDPLPSELGISTIERTFKGKRLGRSSKTSPAAKPSNLAFREQERPYAEANAPLVQGLDEATARRLGYDPERGIFPWLEASHRVVAVAPDEYAVHLPAGNEDTARYVAAQVGQASNAERVRIHVPDYRSGDVVGVGARGTPDQVGALQRTLDNMGITNIVGTGRRSLQVPLEQIGDTRTLNAVQDAASSIGFPEEQVGTYNGRTSDVPRESYAATSEQLAPTFAPTSSVRSDLLQRGLGAVPAERGPPSIVRGRQRGQADVPFATNLGGAAFGGYAGNLATPSDATPEERARNIAAGAAAGFGGTHLITRGLGGRLAPEAVGRPTLEAQLAARPAEGFRAPGRPEGPELRATTQEPPGGPAGRAPRTLGEVHSNPHLLEEARPGETPLSDEELAAHYDQLDTRNQQVQARLDAVDEMLRNPNQKVERPPWSAGLTNLQVAEVARRADISPYEPLWWEKVGMESGSGEVRDVLREGGAFSAGQSQRELTPTELRAERNTLATERRDIQAAADQLGSAPAGTRFTRRAQDAARLPFDVGSEEAAPHGPFATENQGSSGVLAEDIVTRNGTAKRPSGLSGLWSEEGQVGARGERGGRTVTGMGITDAEAAGVGEPTRITRELMPNLDAMLGDDMPEVRAQMQRVVENNQELFAAYQQGRISMASLRDDLAGKVGLSKAEWLKTPIGKAYNERELMALQAVAVDASVGANDLAHDIVAKGGVDALTPEEVAFGLTNMLDAAGVLAVARGGRSTAGRSLNALKQRMTATLARGITASNERISAERLRDQAKRAAVRATQLLNKTRDLHAEARQAVAGARERGAAPNVLRQIEDAYAQLDRYQAMSLHEKGEEFTRLAKERAERAAARKAQVREAPQELLSALKAELKAEQDNFAKRKDTWETMAFWDTKANENVVTKRNAFRGGLYIEQARKAANIAAKEAETERARAFDSELRRKSVMTERASRILEAIGGEKPSRDLLRSFTEAVAADNPMVAAKFLKGLSAAPQGKFAKIVEIARNTNVMRLAGMLAATATHMANATGNGIQVPLELTTHAATIGIDATRSAITGGPRQAYAAELPAMLQAYGPGFLTHLPDAVRLMQTGVSPVELADLSKLRPGFRSGLPGRAGAIVDPAIEMPLRTLQASDVLFRGGAYAMHANRVATRRATQEGYRGAQRAGRASNIVENLEDYPELYKEASDAAARMVYQERRTIPGLGGIRQATPGAELARVGVSQVLPFKTTPANIFSQGLGLSPLGAIGTLEAMGSRGGIAQRVEAGALPRERLDRQTLLAEERAARTLIGTAILGAGLWVGSQTDAAGKPKGMLTAMYDENEASTYPQGWRAWSMRLENPKDGSIDYVPLQNFGAAGVPLAMAAILTDAGRRGKTVMDGQELTRAVTGLGRYAIDNTFLQGVSDWVDALHDPGRAGSKAVEGLVASYGPYSGMGRQIQRAYGVASRNPREGLQALVDAMEANYPGVSGNVPEATTALGDARTPGQTGIGAFIAPVRYDIERDEPTLRALRENDVSVPPAPKVISVGNGWAIDLSEAEQDQLKRARGAAIRDEVAYVLASPRYKQAVRDNDVAYRNQLLAQAVSNAAQNSNIDFQRGMTKEELQARAKRKAAPEPYILGSSAAD
jgi:murein DD-endopeptidase MepM/ murein hydrolase activator NlpD